MSQRVTVDCGRSGHCALIASAALHELNWVGAPPQRARSQPSPL